MDTPNRIATDSTTPARLFSRRSGLLAGLGLLGTAALSGCSPQPPATGASASISPGIWSGKLAELEKDLGVALSVCAFAEGGSTLGYRAEEPFAMCSTFKTILVAALIDKYAHSEGYWETEVPVDPAKLLDYAPIAKKIAGRSMTITQLCDATARYSDNTTANLLIEQLGGTSAVTAFAAAKGAPNTRLDRIEPEMSEAKPGDDRDTSTAKDLAGIYNSLLLGDGLDLTGQAMLRSWMLRNTTSAQKMRAAIPKDAELADKTGSGGYGAMNDVGVIFRKGKPPVTLAILSRGVNAAPDTDGNAEAIVRATEVTLAALG